MGVASVRYLTLIVVHVLRTRSPTNPPTSLFAFVVHIPASRHPSRSWTGPGKTRSMGAGHKIKRTQTSSRLTVTAYGRGGPFDLVRSKIFWLAFCLLFSKKGGGFLKNAIKDKGWEVVFPCSVLYNCHARSGNLKILTVEKFFFFFRKSCWKIKQIIPL